MSASSQGIFVGLCVLVLVVVCVYFMQCVVKENKAISTSLNSRVGNFEDAPKFYVDYDFVNSFDNGGIDGGDTTYDCTPAQVKTCRTMDGLGACKSCTDLRARCIHLNTDTRYGDGDDSILLPANKDPGEGYCLVARNGVAGTCNKYHGQLVLVKERTQDDYLMVYCQCRNAGYVGNTHVDGACDTPFICNGKVQDINVVPADLACDCPEGLEPSRIGDVPTCVPKSASKSPLWPSVSGEEQIDVKQRPGRLLGRDTVVYDGDWVPAYVLDKRISTGLKASTVPNPCRFCPVTGARTDGQLMASQSEGWARCIVGGPVGIPYRMDPEGERILLGERGPDCVLALPLLHVMQYPYWYAHPKQLVPVLAVVDMHDAVSKRFIEVSGHRIPESVRYLTINITDAEAIVPGGIVETFETTLPAFVCGDDQRYVVNGNNLFPTCTCFQVDNPQETLQYWHRDFPKYVLDDTSDPSLVWHLRFEVGRASSTDGQGPVDTWDRDPRVPPRRITTIQRVAANTSGHRIYFADAASGVGEKPNNCNSLLWNNLNLKESSGFSLVRYDSNMYGLLPNNQTEALGSRGEERSVTKDGSSIKLGTFLERVVWTFDWSRPSEATQGRVGVSPILVWRSHEAFSGDHDDIGQPVVTVPLPSWGKTVEMKPDE